MCIILLIYPARDYLFTFFLMFFFTKMVFLSNSPLVGTRRVGCMAANIWKEDRYFLKL